MKTFFVLAALTASLFAGPAAGQPFPAFTLEDQFEKPHTVGGQQLVLISFEREVSEKVNAFLGAQSKGFLQTHDAVYIADISAMPSLISKLFALPKMRDYGYPVLLNRNEDFAEKFDHQEGKLTVYRLKEGKIVSVEFIDADKASALFKD